MRSFLGALREAIERIVGDGAVGKARIVMVDDGSTDGTWEAISAFATARGDSRITASAVRLTRNFGQQAAFCAGLDLIHGTLGCESGDTVVMMDSDGQHPPARIRDLIQARAQGFHHVHMRRTNEVGGVLKRLTSPLFYAVFKVLTGLRLERGSSDFRAISGFFLSQYLLFTESVRFNRGIFCWMGFPTKQIPYEAAPRLSGKTSYTLGRMLRFASVGITYFSSKPLAVTLGAITVFGFSVCAVYGAWEAWRVAHGIPFVPGWATLLAVVTLWGSLLSTGQFLIAIYVARIFDESKKRPAYVTRETL